MAVVYEPKSASVGVGCGIGCTPALSVRHSAAAAAVCGLWRYTEGGPKIWHTFVRLITSSNIDQLFFTFRTRRKFVIIQSLKIPPHLIGPHQATNAFLRSPNMLVLVYIKILV